MSGYQQKDEDMRLLISNYQRKDNDLRQMIAECQKRDEAMRQKDEMIMSLVSSLKDQKTFSGLADLNPKTEYDERSLEPERKTQWSEEQYPRGTYTEHRPEMAKCPEEVLSASGKDLQSSDKSQRVPSKEIVKERITEIPLIENVFPIKTHSSEQPLNQALDSKNVSTEVKNSGVKVKPATFDGSSSWLDYKTHFDMCAELNGWNAKQKGLHLAVSLRGQAQGVLGNLPVGDREDVEKLAKALSERFSPESQTELYRAQLKERQWKHGENIPEFGQRILRLTTLAYPGANAGLIDTLAMGNFIDAISDSEMRLKIQQSRPKVFNEAVKVAVELEAFDKAERQRQGNKYVRGTSCTSKVAEPSANIESSAILQKLDKLLDLNETKKPPYSGNGGIKSKVRCYKCKKIGHIQRNCPENKHQGSVNRKEASDETSVKRVGRFCDKNSSRKKKKKTRRTASANFVEAGMYLPVHVNGIKTDMLIDSGATASLISVDVYEKIELAERPRLKPVKGEMVAINGMNLKIHGYCHFDILIGGCCYSIMAIVAELNTSGILGLDFLTEFECSIELKQKCIIMDGKKIRCEIKGKIGCYRVSLVETVSIPPR
ncbi:MAG: retropepsin-like aspartic protease, partial [Candidatus Thiodiazotropha endolucinida]|nr:retroviral-like aspartic protease family protein [Candidatus Thiodiazotropha taylori]MCW4263950.1 retropepsin-like aspartic protease [Candidatus Thiodiazotropha endolucinida]